MQNRNTKQKQIILDAVSELANHPTIAQVFLHLHKSWPRLAKGTVYRNLNSLAEQGKICKIEMPNAPTRFDHQLHNHYHFKCKICGKMIDSESEMDTKLLSGFCGNSFEVESFNLVINGTCAGCKNKLQNKK